MNGARILSIRFARGGFSFLEILIVVVMMAILAMIIIPKIAGVSDYTRASALATDLETTKRVIELYKLEHGGRSPHVNEAGQSDEENFILRMTSATDDNGAIDANGTCGPYLREWPANPYCESAIAQKILFGKLAITPLDGTTGWYYSRTSLRLHINAPGNASQLHEILKTVENL